MYPLNDTTFLGNSGNQRAVIGNFNSDKKFAPVGSKGMDQKGSMMDGRNKGKKNMNKDFNPNHVSKSP